MLDRIGLPGGATPGRTRGITGLVYRSIDGVAALVGQGADILVVALIAVVKRLRGAPAPA